MRIHNHKPLTAGSLFAVLFIALCALILSFGSLKTYADSSGETGSSDSQTCSANGSSSDSSDTTGSTDNDLTGGTTTCTTPDTTAGQTLPSADSDDDTSQPCTALDQSSDTSDPAAGSTTAGAAADTCSQQSATTGSATVDSTGSSQTPTDSTPTTADDPSCGDPDDSSVPPATGSTTTTTDVNNCDQQAATSGSASADTSGSGGTANSGNADSSLNQVNEVTSSNSTTAPVTYTDNVYGDQTGNIVINPDQLTGGDSTTSGDPNDSSMSTSSDSSSGITNVDNLSAQSGNAGVVNSGDGGSATTGDAEALANIINIIDSAIADQETFEGTINIYGNLYGDILLPEQLIDQLIDPSGGNGTPVLATDSNTADINNAVDLTAGSGNALVTNNGNAGTATSGNAETVLNEANYINSQITAGNLFLVIINVSGQWQGYLLGTIPQSDIALLGGGVLNTNITQFTPYSAEVNADSETINNSVNLTALTGDATLQNDGNGGTATTGDAEAEANLINFINANFDISGWFGILFINVFGNWYGDLTTYNADPPQNQSVVEAVVNTTSDPPTDPSAPSGYWTYELATEYLPGQTYTVVTTTYKTIVTHAKNVAATPDQDKSGRGINYWLALLSLIPILGLVLYERRVSKKR